MNYEIPAELLDLAVQSLLSGAFVMAITNKIKKFVPEDWHWFVPLALSVIGFAVFVELSVESILVALFVGMTASGLYDQLKKSA